MKMKIKFLQYESRYLLVQSNRVTLLFLQFAAFMSTSANNIFVLP